jgi:hypothetical protein
MVAWHARSTTTPRQKPMAKQPVHLFLLATEERIDKWKYVTCSPSNHTMYRETPEDLQVPFTLKRLGFDLFTAIGRCGAGGSRGLDKQARSGISLGEKLKWNLFSSSTYSVMWWG